MHRSLLVPLLLSGVLGSLHSSVSLAEAFPTRDQLVAADYQ